MRQAGIGTGTALSVLEGAACGVEYASLIAGSVVTARQCDPESWAYGTVEAVGTGIATQGWFPLHYVHFDRQVCNLWHGRWKSLPHPRLPDVQNVTVQSLARQMEVAAEHSNGHYDRRARGVRRNDHYDRRATEVRVREDMDEICCNKTTGARLYVGNWDAARKFDSLRSLGIFRIVNCTDNIRDWHKKHYRFKYHKFNIAAFDPGFHESASVRTRYGALRFDESKRKSKCVNTLCCWSASGRYHGHHLSHVLGMPRRRGCNQASFRVPPRDKF